MPNAIAKYVPLHELAARLRLPKSWIKSEADAGRLPHIKAGRHIRFSFEAVEAALLERTENSEGGADAG